MTESAPEKPQAITSYLYYEDVAAALEWLGRVFGFVERAHETIRISEGKVVHAAMQCGAGVVMMGCPGADYRCPKRLGAVTQNLYVYVDDVNAHYLEAKAAGASIVAEPEDTFYGDRRYGAADHEGHHCYFAEKLRPVAPDEWRPGPSDLEGHG